jgi:hypothetical protein
MYKIFSGVPAQADQAKVDLVDVVDEVDEQVQIRQVFHYQLSIVHYQLTHAITLICSW